MARRKSNCVDLRIVSGGQTGVDQAALQAAIDLGLDHGGWCPRGRRCEAGRIPVQFRLRESHSAKYWVRTEQNVVDSDATLILYVDRLRGGTAFTARMAHKHGKPTWRVNMSALGGEGEESDASAVWGWLQQRAIQVLNVAGPRESTAPGIYQQSYAFLWAIFRRTDESLQSSEFGDRGTPQ